MSCKKVIFVICFSITSILLLIIILPLLGRISPFDLDEMRCIENNIFGRNCYIHGTFLFLTILGISILLIGVTWILKTIYINKLVKNREASLEYDGDSEDTSSSEEVVSVEIETN